MYFSSNGLVGMKSVPICCFGFWWEAGSSTAKLSGNSDIGNKRGKRTNINGGNPKPGTLWGPWVLLAARRVEAKMPLVLYKREGSMHKLWMPNLSYSPVHWAFFFFFSTRKRNACELPSVGLFGEAQSCHCWNSNKHIYVPFKTVVGCFYPTLWKRP